MQQLLFVSNPKRSRAEGERGYVTLLAALIVTIVGVSLTTSILLSGGSGALREGAAGLMLEARAYADACAENGLFRVRDGIMYSGSGEISLENGSCSYDVSPNDEFSSIVEAIGYAEAATRKVRVVAETNIVVTESGTSTEITGITWQEVEDF